MFGPIRVFFRPHVLDIVFVGRSALHERLHSPVSGVIFLISYSLTDQRQVEAFPGGTGIDAIFKAGEASGESTAVVIIDHSVRFPIRAADILILQVTRLGVVIKLLRRSVNLSLVGKYTDALQHVVFIVRQSLTFDTVTSDLLCAKLSQFVARTVKINTGIITESLECASLYHIGIIQGNLYTFILYRAIVYSRS